MIYADAKKLRDTIRIKNFHCIVPKGHGPDGYFAKIFGPYQTEFRSDAEWNAYHADYLKRNPPGYVYWRVCIELLNPKPLREGESIDDAILSQHPITDWIDIADAWSCMEHLRRAKPIQDYGLLYGHQEKRVEGDDGGVAAKIAAIKSGGIAYIEEEASRRRGRLLDAEKAVDEFLADFPLELYGLASYAAGMM